MNYKLFLIPVIFLIMVGMVFASEEIISPRGSSITFHEVVERTITLGGLGPDLTFYPPEISFDPSSPVVGQPVDVTAYIINQGDAEANGIWIYAGVILPDGYGYGIFNYWNESEILGPNQTMTKIFSFTPNMSGIHTVYVTVNTTIVDADINQSNNVVWKNITIQAPPTCSGNIKLELMPHIVRKGGDVKARISGLQNCDGKIVYLNGFGRNRWFAWMSTKTCIVSGPGCEIDFKAPTISGYYKYIAKIDKNDDNDFTDPGEMAHAFLKVIGWGFGTIKFSIPGPIPMPIMQSLPR